MIPAVMILGESNAVGLGSSADFLAGEGNANPLVLAYNRNNTGLQPLVLGNADTDEGGVGFELSLTNAVRAGTFEKAFFFKYAVGGTRIDQWITGGQYHDILFQRLNAFKTQINATGTAYKPFIWYSQGINDSDQGTDGVLWQTRTKQHFTELRTIFPDVWIFPTFFTAVHKPYEANVTAVQNSFDGVRSIPTISALQQDGNHWNTSGYRVIGDRMVAKTVANYGLPFVGGTVTASPEPILFFFGL